VRYDDKYRVYQHSGGVMSLPPDPPLSTSLSHLIFKEICPIDGRNYTNSLSTFAQYVQMTEIKQGTFTLDLDN